MATEFFEQRTDAALGGEGVAFQFTRTYRSRVSFNGPLGYSWDHNYDQRILYPDSSLTVTPACDNTLDFQDGQLNIVHFEPAGQNVWRAKGTGLTLAPLGGGWKMTAADGSWRFFDAKGFLMRIVDVVGNELSVVWDDASVISSRRVLSVSDGVRVVHFVYRSDDLLQCISLGTDCGNETSRSADVLAYFTYTVANELQSVLHGQDVVGERIAYLATNANVQYGPLDCIANATLDRMCTQLCGAVDPTNPATCHNLDIAKSVDDTCSSVFGCVLCDARGPGSTPDVQAL